MGLPRRVILRGESQRAYAKELIDAALPDSVVSFSDPKRTTDQNAKMWAMLHDISDHFAGRCDLTPERWKCFFMDRCGHEVKFELGPDGEVFPYGFSSSEMTKRQMADLITFIIQWGDEYGVVWKERMRAGFN